MAFYAEEEDVWKCTKHPAGKRRRCNGVCPACLRERLGSLCPDCANVRPCACCAAAAAATTTTISTLSSSSSSSSSASCDVAGATGLVERSVDREPAFRRSRSVGVPFLRSRFAAGEKEKLRKDQKYIPVRDEPKTLSFWSIFRSRKSKKGEEIENRENEEEAKDNENENNNVVNENYLYKSKIEDFERMMMRSRSVSVSMTSARGGGDFRSSPLKVKGWHFTSPMKVFRHKSSSKVVHDRSPLQRG